MTSFVRLPLSDPERDDNEVTRWQVGEFGPYPRSDLDILRIDIEEPAHETEAGLHQQIDELAVFLGLTVGT